MSQYQLYITSSNLPSIHPNQDVFPFTIGSFPQTLRDKTSGSIAIGVGFNDTENFTGEVLNNVISSSYISPSSPLSNKIRIIDSQTEGNVLNPYLKIEKSSPFDYSIDTNELFIGFSQTKQINKDIVAQLGTNFSLDEYIGEPNYQYSSSYDNLKGIRKHYFSKYQGRNNINNFINLTSKYDHSVLNLVEKVIPSRTNETIGNVIEPSILERSKISRIEPFVSDVSYSSSINLNPISSGETLILEQTISKTKESGSVDISNNNIDTYAFSETYTKADGSPANYEPGLTLNTLSIYGRSFGLNYLTNSNITNPNPTSTLVYVFDSLIPYRAPIINLLSDLNDLQNYFQLFDGEPQYIGVQPFFYSGTNFVTGIFYTEKQANSILLKSQTFGNEYFGIKTVLTSSYFNIEPGQILTISGSYFQPELGAFNLGVPGELPSEKFLIDSCSSTSSWNNAWSPRLTLTTGSGFPWPSGSNETYLLVNLDPTSTFDRFPIYKTYNGFPTDNSKIRIYFYVVTSVGNAGGEVTVYIRQAGTNRGSKTFNIANIYYNPTEQYIDFISISSSIEFRIEHGYNGGNSINYKIDSISTASFSSTYNSPYARIRILTGSYSNFTSSEAGQSFPSGTYNTGLTEILSTGLLRGTDFTSQTIPFSISQIADISSSYTNAFFEIEFFVSKSFNTTASSANAYNANPISLNNLVIDPGGTQEAYAFRIEKVINIDTENIDSSEVINKDDSYFVSYIDNELNPSYQFSITSFDNFPNRLKPSYNVYTASFGPRIGFIERGNLTNRNYVPISLTIGSNEEDDLPNYYNFDGGGILIPVNTSTSFNTIKQDIINFSKLVKNNNSQDF
jgi:hypothetical protein